MGVFHYCLLQYSFSNIDTFILAFFTVSLDLKSK